MMTDVNTLKKEVFEKLETIILDGFKEDEFEGICEFSKYEGVPFIIFHDWETVGQVNNIIGNMGYDEIEDLDHLYDVLKYGFSDEYTTCSDCNQVIKTSPDSYMWQPDFYFGDGYIVCNECFNNETGYQEAYLEERINNSDNANQVLTHEQLTDLGFIQLDGTYESGYHEGQDDNPKEIYNRLKDKYDEILFNIDSVGQFDMNFSVYVRE